MTRSQLAEILAYVEGAWPQRPVSDATGAVWWVELSHLDADVVLAAVRAVALAGREHPPTPGHLLGEIAEQIEDAPAFGAAWEQLLRAIRAHGCRHLDRVVDALEHPAVQELARQTGLRELGMAPESDLTTWHAQARERYAAITRRRRRELTHGQLPPATVDRDRLTFRHAPRLAGGAIRELVAALEPGEAQHAA